MTVGPASWRLQHLTLPPTWAEVRAPAHLVVLALAAAAVYAVGSGGTQYLSPLWPLAAVALALGLLRGLLAGLLLSAGLALATVPWWGWNAIAGGFGAVGAVLLGVLLLRRDGRVQAVDDVRSYLLVVAVAGLGAPAVDGLLGQSLRAVVGAPPLPGTDEFVSTQAFLVQASLWFAADAIACLLVPVPFLIWWSRAGSMVRQPWTARNVLFAAATAVALVAGSWVILVVGGVPTGYLVLFPVVWVAIHWHSRGVVLATYVVTLVIGVVTTLGVGTFLESPDVHPELDELLRIYSLVALLLLGGVLVAVVTLQRDVARAGLAEENVALSEEAAEQARVTTTLMDNLPGVAYRCRNDADYSPSFVSAGAVQVYGYPQADFDAGRMDLARPIDPGDREMVRVEVDAAIAADRPFLLSYRIRRADGQMRWVWEQGRAVGTDADGVAILEGFIHDVTEQVTSQQLLADESRLLDAVLAQGSRSEVLRVLRDLVARNAPGADVTVLGLEDETVTHRYVAAAHGPSDDPSAPETAEGAALPLGSVWDRARRSGTTCRGDDAGAAEAAAPAAAGQTVGAAAGLTVCPVRGSDGMVLALVGLRPRTDAVPPAQVAATEHLAEVAAVALGHLRVQERLRHEALHDGLTGLPNRRGLQQEVAHRTAAGRPLGALFLDVSGFRVVNETYGHSVGDDVLQLLAARTQAAVPPEGCVGRFAGDQFVVLVEEADPEALSRLARVVQRVASGPYRIGQQALVLSVAVGVAVAGDTGTGDVLADASAACVGARDLGRDGVLVYDAGLHERSRFRLHTETALRRALGTDEIETWFQPEYDLRTGAFLGAEALVRWRRGDGSRLAPDQFLPIAESAGLVTPLGLRVLAEACTQAMAWPRALAEGASSAAAGTGPGETGPAGAAPRRDVMVAVNVAAQQLLDPAFLGSVADVLGFTRLPASRLCLEITETALEDADAAERALRQVRDLGILIAIDDFGTGYSSLSRLKRFPVDFLKIDRSFVTGVGTDPDDTAIVDAIVALSRALRLRTVAEGVETAAQAQELRARGVDLAQGFLWSRPIPPDRLLALLREPGHGSLRSAVGFPAVAS